MKRNYILLTILVTILLVLAGCAEKPGMFSKFYGRAIHTYTPPSTPDLDDFPEQFLVDDDTNYILSFEHAIVADQNYNLNSFYNAVQAKMCSIVNDAGYDCTDTSDTVISTPTGSFFSNLITGNVVYDNEVDAIYRCYVVQGPGWSGCPNVMNHFLSKDPTCGGGVNQVDGLVGYLYKTQKPNTVAITQCYRSHNHCGHDYYDHAVSEGTSCPAGWAGASLLGYAPTTENNDTKKIYRCWNYPDHISDGRFDHMVSAAIGCEGYNNENVIFNFIKEVSSAPLTEAKTTLYVCSKFKSGGAIDYYVHTSSSCPVGNLEFVLGQVYTQQHPDTSKLVYCYWPNQDEHLIALNQCDATTLWRADLGYVYTTQQTGTVPLVRCRTDLKKFVPIISQDDEHFQLAADSCPSGSVLEGKWYMFPFCTDTDAGKEYGVQGTTTSNLDQSTATDSCGTDGKLTEYFCDNKNLPSGINSEVVDCSACSNGVCTLPAPTTTRTIYRCYVVQGPGWSGCPNVMNHFLSADATCGGGVNQVDGPVGDLYISPSANYVPVTQCYRETEHCGHDYSDHFVVAGNCPSGTIFNGVLGYAPKNASTDTKIIYRCHNRPDSISEGRFDHMVSSDILCETYDNEYVTFNFLKSTAKSAQGGACTITDDCVAGLECVNNICDSAPWPNGHSCTLNTDCDSNYCNPSSNVCADSPFPERNHIYRCWWVQHWSGGPHVMNHYVSTDPACGGNRADGLMGDLYQTQQANTVPLHQCYRGHRFQHHNYVDHFIAANGCPIDTNDLGIIGYAPLSADTNTITVHRCWNRPDRISEGRFDHMISTDFACEMYDNEAISFNFLNPVFTPKQQGESCSAMEECELGLDCINSVCTASPWPNGHSCEDNSECISGYCDADTFTCMDQQYETNPIYRCYWVQGPGWSGCPNVINHYVSFEADCGGNSVDGLMGHVYKEARPNTVPVYQCFRSHDHCGHTYTDHFIAANACPATADVTTLSLLGHAPVDTGSGIRTIHWCWNRPDHISDGRFDHMISTLVGCEGYNNENNPFYFLEQPIALGGVSTPTGPYCGDGIIDFGEQCEFDMHCSPNQTCIACVCVGNATGPPWPIGYACTNNADCISQYCNPSTNLCDTNPPWTNGHGCTSDAQCTSGYCNPSTNVCADQPTTQAYQVSIPASIPPAGLLLTNFDNWNTVLIGTCNDNDWVAAALGITECNALTAGRALIMIQHNPYRLIVAGDSTTDVLIALNVLNNADNYDLHGPRVDITYVGTAITVTFPHCSDNVRNYDETGVDCGGSCAACPTPPMPPATPGAPGAIGGSGGGSSWYGQEILEQEATECMDDWICDMWSDCSPSGIQTRVCHLNDYPECHLIMPKPAETQSCTPPYVAPVESCFDGIQNQGEEGIDCGGPCAACPSKKPLWLVPTIIILLCTAIALGFLVYYMKFIRKPNVASPLKKYVREVKGRGFKEPRIRQKLRTQGWAKTEIDKAMK